MAGVVETVSTFNSVARTILALAVVSIVGGGGWWGYRAIEAGKREALQRDEALQEARAELEGLSGKLAQNERLLAAREQEVRDRDARIRDQEMRIDSLDREVQEGRHRIEQLQTTMRLLTVDRRIARLTVLDQAADPATGEIVSTVEFVELDDRGEPLDEPRVFPIRGDVVYVDNWVVKFDERYLEDADELRSASLVLFRRIFGENQEPVEGHVLDRVGARPRAYSAGAPLSDFERRIWEDFWTIADDPQRAGALGIRAAHGEAVSMKVRKGRSYRLQLRASDGLSIVPDGPGGRDPM